MLLEGNSLADKTEATRDATSDTGLKYSSLWK
jgi:hypothetical protein